MEQINESLLIRYFSEELSESEIIEVENWILSSDENRKIAKDIYAIQMAIDTYDTMKNVDADKALKKIDSLLYSSDKEFDRPKTKTWIRQFQRIAAILVLPLLLVTSYLYLLTISESNLEGQFVEVRTTSGMTSYFTLPDSTKVWLNSDSYVRYPLQFASDMRQVQLVGEAFFDVTKDEKKQFIVKTINNTSIQVLGTSFNVEAYEDINEISTSLVSGKIKFTYTDTDQVKRYLDLSPNQKITYDRESRNIALSNTNVMVDTAWKDGKVIFYDTPFEDVLRILEKKFSVLFEVKNPKLKDLYFTGVFTYHPLEEILKHFEVASKVKHKYQTRTSGEKQIIELYF